METSLRESPTVAAGTSNSPFRRRNSPHFRAGWALLACSAAVALSSCSAGQAEGTDGGSSPSAGSSQPPAAAATTIPAMPSPSSPETPAESLELVEPIPHAAKEATSAARSLLSQQGNGLGTYAVEGLLEPGEVLSMSASCTSGDKVTLTADNPALKVVINCENPTGTWITSQAVAETIGDMTVTVETAGGAPFWVTAWAHQPQQHQQ